MIICFTNFGPEIHFNFFALFCDKGTLLVILFIMEYFVAQTFKNTFIRGCQSSYVTVEKKL